MRLYVGNLAFRSNAEDVRKAFAAFGQVTHVELAIDRATGRSAGYAFVEMPDDEQAQTAIARLKEINSRVVSVHVASEVVEPERPADRERRAPRPGRSDRPRDSGPGSQRPRGDDRPRRTDRPYGENRPRDKPPDRR